MTRFAREEVCRKTPRERSLWLLLGLLWIACSAEKPLQLAPGPPASWPHYGGDLGGLRYSPLADVTPENVDRLELAWVYHHGDISDGSDGTTRTSFNATPIQVGESLYFCTGFHRVIALDAATGAERWVYDPRTRLKKVEGPYTRACRGVAYWRDAERAQGEACSERIFVGTIDSELIALDAASGVPCAGFDEDGRVDLREGLGPAPAWESYPTSPPLVIHDVVVIGSLVSDNLRADPPGGVVRGFDARSGELRWAWDPVPPGWPPVPEGEAQQYTRGTPNAWSILSGDSERGLVFVPTGNAAPDAFAAQRAGLDTYASSVVALDASTGERVWHFQTVHHDVWDYDVASQPTLLELEGEQGPVAALAQATKMGHIFLLDRETGEPLFPVEERPVPQGGVPGEKLSPTQPFPTHPAPLTPAPLRPENAFGFTFWDRGRCAQLIASYRSEGIFTPPSLEGSIQFPGSAGGANWGGVSIDPESKVLFVNQLHMPSIVTLIPREDYESFEDKTSHYPSELLAMEGVPYAVRREPLLSPLGAPCNPPPWGTLTAVDLVSGDVLWESTLGTTRDQAPFPLWFDFGSPNLGGSIVTAGGLVFIGATTDRFLRAFDARSGEEIWRERLPYTANATPLSYRVREGGKQFIVVAAGGHGWSVPGDAVMAWALP